MSQSERIEQVEQLFERLQGLVPRDGSLNADQVWRLREIETHLTKLLESVD